MGVVIRGTQRIFNSTVAHVGMLYAQRKQVFKEYHNIVFERFWKRELDIEDPTVIAAVLSEAGANVSPKPYRSIRRCIPNIQTIGRRGGGVGAHLWTTPTLLQQYAASFGETG